MRINLDEELTEMALVVERSGRDSERFPSKAACTVTTCTQIGAVEAHR